MRGCKSRKKAIILSPLPNPLPVEGVAKVSFGDGEGSRIN
jgi:hypothetical protein